MLFLCLFSVVFIYSAQSYSGGTQWKMQIFWIVIGLGLYTLISLLDYKFFLEHAHFFYFGCIFLLLLLWTPLGERRFSALRWLNFGAFQLQPSETAKIGTLIMISSILSRSKLGSVKDSLSVLTKVSVAFLVPILLIFLQPDLGSSLVFPPMVFALLYVSKLSERFFATAFAGFLLLLGILGWDIYSYNNFLEEHELNALQDTGAYEKTSWFPLKDYQRNRILSFVAPDVVDPQGIGVSWNLRQSLIAVGTGGAFGKGHNQGTQAKLGYLPQSVAPNDFIFSVLAEEKGFMGATWVILLYAIMAVNGIRIAGLARDRFGMFLAVGASVLLVVHVFINVGMTIGIMPITGLPLPFLSYGGTFVLSCCVLQGLIQSVYRHRSHYS